MTAPHLDPTTLRHLGQTVMFEHNDDPEPITARFVTFEHRGLIHRTVIVRHGGHRVEMTVSPTGSSVHVDATTVPTLEKP